MPGASCQIADSIVHDRVAAECAIVAVVVYYATGAGNTTDIVLQRPPGVAEGDCRHYIYHCSVTSTQMGLIGIMIFFPVLYFVVFCVYLRQAFLRLRKEPYSDFKIGNLLVRLMVGPPDMLCMLCMLTLDG